MKTQHTHGPVVTVRHVEAQAASGPHRPAMPEHYVTEWDGKPLCWIPVSALAPLLAEAEARGAREALVAAADAFAAKRPGLSWAQESAYTSAATWLRNRAEQVTP